MRLSVFSPEYSTQLLIDLQKIYQPYFSPEELTTESLQTLIEDKQSQLFVTLFNARHLGAVRVCATEHEATLSLLSVRDLTRRRGIAKNLLKEVEKHLKNKNMTVVKMCLDKFPEQEKEGLTLFMLACGYSLTDGLFSKNL
ncbi:MAG: GNAT superfamily N-acetyltransferase [Psychromonas sp.]|jgi:GNAT superfamily N-acetyltransferase|uniref:aspartate 1-decarboxylase autocleavage activator PanM n=1 Tax=Psychromonas sp. TaxID=1884585 RepID=UPI0039E56021